MNKQVKDKSGVYATAKPRSKDSARMPMDADGIGARIAELSDMIGSRVLAAEAMQISTATLQRYIRNENMPPFDVAFRLCQAAGMPMEWLATGADDAREPPQETAADKPWQPVRRDVLKMALELAAEVLDGKVLSRSKHAELVTLTYELLEEGLPKAKVLRFVRAASA